MGATKRGRLFRREDAVTTAVIAALASTPAPPDWRAQPPRPDRHAPRDAADPVALAQAQQDVELAARKALFPLAGSQLAEELRRLDRLHRLAAVRPAVYARAVAGRAAGLALWLYGVGLGLAGQGLGEAALLALDVLPGIDGGGGGRAELLAEIIADAAGDHRPEVRHVG